MKLFQKDKFLNKEEELVSISEQNILEGMTQSKESIFKAPLLLLLAAIPIFLGIFHLFNALNPAIDSYFMRTIHLSLMVVLVFLIKPLGRKAIFSKKNGFFIIDLLCIVATIGVLIYVLYDVEGFLLRAGSPNSKDIIAGTIMIILVLEATRRVVGIMMFVISGFFLLHTAFANFFPGFLNGPPSSLKSMITWIWMLAEGIYSIPIAVMANYIFLFVVFGVLMMKTGAGQLFIDIALAATGKKAGGPAKAAVIASAVMGTVSGSAVANIVTTGTFTIPLMKKVGFKSKFAGAVEACASGGGQIMPPVMAATAFIMAEIIGVPYIVIVKTAILPAFLYFYSVFKMVEISSIKYDVKGLKEENLPDLKENLKKGWHLLTVLGLLIGMIIAGFSPALAVSTSIIALLIVATLRKNSRLPIEAIFSAIEAGAKMAAPVSIACGAAGLIIGSISVSGLGLRLTSVIIGITGGNIWFLLFLAMISALILGMGMPTAGVYITLSALVVPGLIHSGINLMASHFFPFYFGVFSNITPPVCLGAYTAAGIAKSGQTETAFESLRIGACALLLPYAFVLHPGLLMQGTAFEIIKALPFAFFAVNSLAYAMTGWYYSKIGIVFRIVFLLLTLGLLSTSLIVQIIALAVYFIIYLSRKNIKK